MSLPDLVLAESISARNVCIANLSHERAQEILNKVKSLVFALWQGNCYATTERVAEFYEVSVETTKKAANRHRAEFESDGLKTLRGNSLKQVRDILSLSFETSQALVWTPRAAIRLGMLLRDSQIAQQVRTTVLNVLEAVPDLVQGSQTPTRTPTSNIDLGNFGLAVAKIEILAQWLERHNIHLLVQDQAKLNALVKASPEDAPIIDVFKRVLESIVPQQQQDLNPTQLAEKLTEQLGRKISAHKVNQALEELGLQYKLFSGEDWRWDLTDKGKEFGKIYLVTGKPNQWSGGQLKWNPDLVNLLVPHLADTE